MSSTPSARSTVRKTCLRCDWDGRSAGPECPLCSAPLFVPPGEKRGDRSVGGRSDASTPPPPAAPPPTPADGLRSRRRDRRDREGTALTVTAAALVVMVVAGTGWLPSSDDRPRSRSFAAERREAVTVASRFLDAYGDLDAERAIASLAPDARLTLLIRSIGADDVQGTRRELRLFLAMLGAWRYRHDVESCAATATGPDGTGVRCDFSYDFLGSDELRVGPYSGSSFDLTVDAGRLTFVSKFWAFDRFAQEMWEPFATWVWRAHPRDARRMYDDETRVGARLTRPSISRWKRRTAEYVARSSDGRALADLPVDARKPGPLDGAGLRP